MKGSSKQYREGVDSEVGGKPEEYDILEAKW